MKQLIIGLTAATLMAGGLVGISAESANAVCPYTGCVPTAVKITIDKTPVKKGSKAKACIKVTTTGGGTPKGRVQVAVVRNNGGFKWINSKKYQGSKVCFTTPKLTKKGKYTVRGTFEAAASTVYGDSDNTAAFSVKNKV